MIHCNLQQSCFAVRVEGKNFDPRLPDELNTLKQLSPGKAYWIKVNTVVPNFKYTLPP